MSARTAPRVEALRRQVDAAAEETRRQAKEAVAEARRQMESQNQADPDWPVCLALLVGGLLFTMIGLGLLLASPFYGLRSLWLCLRAWWR